MQSTSYADIENAYRAGGHHEDDDSEAKDPMGWTGPPGSMPLASPSLAPRIRKNKMSSGGVDYQHLLSMIEMQGNSQNVANQQIMSMLQQVINMIGGGHDPQQQHLMQGLVDSSMMQPAPINIQHMGGKIPQNSGGRRKTQREEMEEAEAAKRVRHEEGGN